MKLEKKPIKRKDKKNFSIREDFFKQKIVWKAVGRNLAFSILEGGFL